MPETLREKVERVLDAFAEGGPITRIMRDMGVRRGDFYKGLQQNPDLELRYEQMRRDGADMALHECVEIATDLVSGGKEGTSGRSDHRAARAAADILKGIAEKWDPKRYGAKLAVENTQVLDLAGAIEAAKLRALRPRCDPELIVDADYKEISTPKPIEPPDSQSVSPASPAVDPFED